MSTFLSLSKEVNIFDQRRIRRDRHYYRSKRRWQMEHAPTAMWSYNSANQIEFYGQPGTSPTLKRWFSYRMATGIASDQGGPLLPRQFPSS